MRELILTIAVATTPIATAQQNTPKPPAADSIRSLAVEIGPNSPMPGIAFVASRTSKPKFLAQGVDPVLSPDGIRIAYCKQEWFGSGQLEVMNTDGSRHMQLTKLIGGACPTDWSPDGQKIAFNAGGPRSPSIFVMDTNGDNLKRISEGYGARWSPDGKQLVFCRGDSIWIANADGSDPTKVIVDRSPLLNPSWFPDGKSIVFASERESKSSAIFRVNLDGSGLRAVAADKQMGLFFPIVSPDGTQILADAASESGQVSVLLFDLATHHATMVTHGKHPSALWAKP